MLASSVGTQSGPLLASDPGSILASAEDTVYYVTNRRFFHALVVKKVAAASTPQCAVRNVWHEVGRCETAAAMRLRRIVHYPTRCRTFFSVPRIRVQPHVGFFSAMRTTSLQPGPVGGRPRDGRTRTSTTQRRRSANNSRLLLPVIYSDRARLIVIVASPTYGKTPQERSEDCHRASSLVGCGRQLHWFQQERRFW
jgi:hypothetical protein